MTQEARDGEKQSKKKSRDQLTLFGLPKDLEDYYNIKVKLQLSYMQIIWFVFFSMYYPRDFL